MLAFDIPYRIHFKTLVDIAWTANGNEKRGLIYTKSLSWIPNFPPLPIFHWLFGYLNSFRTTSIFRHAFPSDKMIWYTHQYRAEAYTRVYKNNDTPSTRDKCHHCLRRHAIVILYVARKYICRFSTADPTPDLFRCVARIRKRSTVRYARDLLAAVYLNDSISENVNKKWRIRFQRNARDKNNHRVEMVELLVILSTLHLCASTKAQIHTPFMISAESSAKFLDTRRHMYVYTICEVYGIYRRYRKSPAGWYVVTDSWWLGHFHAVTYSYIEYPLAQTFTGHISRNGEHDEYKFTYDPSELASVQEQLASKCNYTF